MDNSSCEWIRGRLSLDAGGDGPGVDLGDGDRRAIERHLSACLACRGRRAELVAAMRALAAVAATSPGDPAAPSLWPALERRIATRGVGASASAWSRLDDDRPLRTAWAQDSLREAAEAVGLGDGADRPGRRPWSLLPAGVRRVAVASLAASILMLSLVLPVAWRLRAAAEARELAFAEPVTPLLVGPPAPIEPGPSPGADERLADLDAGSPALVPDFDEPAARRDRGREHKPRGPVAGQLAQADPIRPPAPLPTPESPPPPGPSRFGYELELGTPMPPDGRDARPIY